ncbi:MAG: cupin domain-containing protein [Halobacteriota archaeon]
MEPIHLPHVVEELEATDERDLEFLRTETLSLEVYRLGAGSADPQEPHTEDEVYYVLKGRADIRVEDERHPVQPGDVIHVERGVDHRFVDIEEDLVALVVFTPPFGSLATA